MSTKINLRPLLLKNLTGLATIVVSAVMAFGAVQALAATGAAKADAAKTILVDRPAKKLDREWVWKKQARDFECMYNERR